MQLSRNLQPPEKLQASTLGSSHTVMLSGETSLIIVWELEEMPEILRFAQDDNSVFEYGAWNLNLQISSSEPG